MRPLCWCNSIANTAEVSGRKSQYNLAIEKLQYISSENTEHVWSGRGGGIFVATIHNFAFLSKYLFSKWGVNEPTMFREAGALLINLSISNSFSGMNLNMPLKNKQNWQFLQLELLKIWGWKLTFQDTVSQVLQQILPQWIQSDVIVSLYNPGNLRNTLVTSKHA